MSQAARGGNERPGMWGGGPCQFGNRLDAALYRVRVEVYQV